MNKILCLILFLLSITSAYATNRGYVWIPATGYYDVANFGDKRVSHKKPYFQSLPLINAEIELRTNNKIFFNYKTIEYIDEMFREKQKKRECPIWKATFTSYFLSLEKDTSCDVNRDLFVWLKKNAIRKGESFKSLFYFLEEKSKVRVLGYVQFNSSVFAYVEVLKN